MDNDRGKGKAIASESDGKSPQESVRNHEVRASNSITREISLPNPRLNEYNFGIDPSNTWVMHGGRFLRETDLPPLARRTVYGSVPTRWVRVGFPSYRDISWIYPQNFVNHNREGTRAQGAAMFRGSTTRGIYFPAPRPTVPRPTLVTSHIGQNYLPIVQPGFLFYGYPNICHIPRYYVNSYGEGTSTHSALGNGVPNNRETNPYCVPSTSFNPSALEWSEAPIEGRSLFITFSHGEPLTNKQIFWFLAWTFGIRNLLEVDIHQPRQGPAHFGRVVFTTATIPMMILNGQEEARMEINNRSMIFKKYVPKENRATR